MDSYCSVVSSEIMVQRKGMCCIFKVVRWQEVEGILIKLINLNDRCYEVTVVTSTDSTMLF